MAVTRKLLKGMGLTEEQVDTIIEAHAETVDSLKEQVDSYKEDAEKLAGIQKQLKEAQAEVESLKKDSYKVKYEALKEDFDSYKETQTKKETHEAKETAYRELLKKVGISDKRIKSVLKVSDIDGIELDDDGKIKDADSLEKAIKDEWSDFIETTETKGANVPKPPANEASAKDAYEALSLSEKMKYANEHPQEVAEWNKQKG